MVDFRKKLSKSKIEKAISPLQIYEKLDRASDKGPLRPAQTDVLEDWHRTYRNNRDIIVKLHTGQGKTLVGLLMLQSKMNEVGGSALYLCPNNYLVHQTAAQAQQFGIRCVTTEDELPHEFYDGKAILVITVKKLFNGLTKFDIGSRSLPVSHLLMDDAHTCIDIVKDAFTISLKYDHPAYQQILQLFGSDLTHQGSGTFEDIKQHDYSSYLPVPYWAWQEKHNEVTTILSKNSNDKSIRFVWPLIKDHLENSLCIISGNRLEIVPNHLPLHMIGSFYKAQHRIFMSATVIDDSFLVKGLELSEKTIENPLTYEGSKWSGEKMIIIPSLIDSTLDRTEIVHKFTKPIPKPIQKYGIVSLCPSFSKAGDWKANGATKVDAGNIHNHVENLRNGDYEKTLVVSNRYDGIDLPDNTCRVLIFDSKPFSEHLLERYLEGCREGSEVINTKLATTIEQGIGRAVRGEKDYCVIVLTGSDLIKVIRTSALRDHFSDQTRTQIEIGLEIAEFSREEIDKGTSPMKTFASLLNQSLKRDEGWKQFYVEKMNEGTKHQKSPGMLSIFIAEIKAEKKYEEQDYEGAVQTIQDLIDQHIKLEADKGWYLQEMARFIYPSSKTQSNQYQIEAHKKNNFLLKPKKGMKISKIPKLSQERIERIVEWAGKFDSFEDLNLAIDDILTSLEFGIRADKFEEAVDNLAAALGFSKQRPDKEWGAGPDNLWYLKEHKYLLIECKNEVRLDRDQINKYETGQMNNSIAWFNHNYPGAISINLMIIPTLYLNPASGFNEKVGIMRNKKLKLLKNNSFSFFQEFRKVDLKNVSKTTLQEWINEHKLSVEDLINLYSEEPKR